MTARIRRQSGRRDADRTGDKQRAAEGEQTAAGRMKSRRESPTEEKRKEPANVEHNVYSVALQIKPTLQPFVLFSQAKLKLRFLSRWKCAVNYTHDLKKVINTVKNTTCLV